MILVQLHLIVLSFTAVAILIADHDGLQYFFGKKQTLDPVRVKRLHYTVLTGLILMIITGGLMFADVWGEVIENPAFYVKMCMVLALIANSFIIGNLMHVATQRPFVELTREERHTLLASGAVSGICWIGAALIGLLYL